MMCSWRPSNLRKKFGMYYICTCILQLLIQGVFYSISRFSEEVFIDLINQDETSQSYGEMFGKFFYKKVYENSFIQSWVIDDFRRAKFDVHLWMFAFAARRNRTARAVVLPNAHYISSVFSTFTNVRDSAFDGWIFTSFFLKKISKHLSIWLWSLI